MKASTLNRKLKRARAKAYALEPDLIAVYEKQIVKAGNDIAREFARQATSHLPAHAVAAAADGTPPADWTPPPEGDIMAGARTAATRAVRPVHERILRESVGGSMLGIAFDVTSPTSQTLLGMLGKRAGDIEAGLREPVARAIQEAYEAGSTIPQAATAIREVTSGLAGWQATMLARTDLISLANGGSEMAVQAVNENAEEGEPLFGTKVWLATMDDRTRETHAEADGQEVPIDAQFEVGEDLLDYPGDPNGSDEEVINCRCTVLYDETATSEDAGMAASADTLGGTMPNDAANSVTAGVTITISDAEVEGAPEFTPVPWRAVLALEGVPTIDGRFFPVDSMSWRELPLSLLAQTETQPGHDGAEVCGRIDRIWREAQDDGTTHIMGEGEFTGEEGAEIAPMVADESLRGLSIDVAVKDTGLRDPDTGEIVHIEDLTDDDFFDMMFGQSKFQTVMYGGVIGSATVCAFPAFDDANISVVAAAYVDAVHHVSIHSAITLLPAEPLTASAAGLAPEAPPSEWFTDPALDRLTALTVTDEGRVVGHLAGWDTCHIGSPGGPGTCTVAPNSAADYRYFHTGAIETAEGDEISVGQITLDTGHASLNANRQRTLRHYDDTGTAVADVRVGEDAHGIWVAGAVRPDITPAAVRKLKGAALSGDWRSIDHHLELVAALCVNVPGFPIPRAQAAIAASGATAMVATGIVVDATELEGTVTCAKCGAENEMGASVCADCGGSLPGAMSAEEFMARLDAMAALAGVE